MNDIAITTWLVLGSLVVLVAWDVYVALINRVPNSKDTISGQTLAAARRAVGLPFAFGGLGGHFFWPRSEALFGKGLSLALLAAIALALIVAQVPFRRRTPAWAMPAAVAIGFACGHLLWPQQ